MIQTMKFAVVKIASAKSRGPIVKTVSFLAVAVFAGVFTPSADAQSGSIPTGNQSPGNQFTRNRADTIQTTRSQSIGNQAATNQALSNQALGNQSLANQSLRNQPFGSQLLQNQFSDNGRFGSHTAGLKLLEERLLDEEADPAKNISLARERVVKAKKELTKVQELSRLGSASQTEVRTAELSKWLALLALSDLMSPDSELKNSRLRAQLIFNYRDEELGVIKKLYERGSTSELKYRRAITARNVAEAELKAVKSDSDAKQKFHAMTAASSKYKEAQNEHQMATKLFESGSLNRAAMDQVSENLEAAKSELADARESFNETANQVQ